jgi:hypothetical protein
MNPKELKLSIFAFASSFLIAGCSHYINEKDLNLLHLKMTKEEAQAKLKDSGITRGATFVDGSATEVIEYKSKSFFNDFEECYHLYFEDGRLVQWGKPSVLDKNKYIVCNHLVLNI